MPCSDGRDDHSEVYERADRAARAACEALKLLEQTELYPSLSPETRAWWNEHKERDRIRIARELEAETMRKAKEAALSKLTAAERRALGIWY